MAADPNAGSGAGDGGAGVRADALIEHLTDDWGFFIRSTGGSRNSPRLTRRSRFTTPRISATVPARRPFMTSEMDEFFYHENLVHMAALTHPQPERALIIGGGDGGSAEELLKHPSVKSVTLCELDLAVVDIAREHLQSVLRVARRCSPHSNRGRLPYVTSRGQYDLIVLDLTDPGGPSESLYTQEFYRACGVRLKPVGAMTLHIASPIAHPDRIRACLANLRAAFPLVTPYLTSVPLYGGMWMMACASQTLDPRSLSAREVDRRIAQRGLSRLQYYNGDMHRAALALPNFVRDLVG
jgi:spermidine synthase